MVSIINPVAITASPPGSEPATPIGRVKEPPVCRDATLKKAALTTEEIRKSVFVTEGTILTFPLETSASDVIPASSSSSTCTRESDSGAFSDAELGRQEPRGGETTILPRPSHIFQRSVTDRMNASASRQKTSRQGRASQRWVTESGTCEPIRLVTGCVPILRGGKILFVSASRKSEWILPKGGWEQDETAEESAVRECFEEAGVLGTLGPKLTVIQYETRKAKKRRLEQEHLEQQKRTKAESDVEDMQDDSKISPTNADAVLSDEAITRIRQVSQVSSRSCDETASFTSSISSAPYSQVRLTLFPLYVGNVSEKWPESGRLRTAIDIDEAINMLDNRPEFKAALKEIKQRGLHLVTDPIPR